VRTASLFFLVVLAACSTTSAPPPPSGDGTISGVVTNNTGTGLPGVSVQATPSTGGALPSVTTSANGSYTIPNVPAGTGVVAVTNVPSTCTAPPPSAYPVVSGGETVTMNVTVACTATNSLVVVITGAAGVTPSATVTGPGSYSKTVSATTTLTGLASGTYTVTTPPGSAIVSSPIVTTTYSASVLGSPANVSSSVVDTVYVTYASDGTGALWFDGAYGATVAQLSSSGTITPNDSCNGVNGQQPFAFDAKGNLWTFNGVGNNPVETLVEFDTTQLANECNANPTVLISGEPGVSTVTGMAFDSHGTLWISSLGPSDNSSTIPYIFGYTAAQLKSTGSPAPAYMITPNGLQNLPGVLSYPLWIAFDASGDLWVDDNSQILEYTPSQLASSGSPTPQMLALTNMVTQAATYIGFDASGNLWALNANTGSGSVLSEFSKSSLASLSSNSSPAPVGGMSMPQTSFNTQSFDWLSFAFDNSGNMWMLTEGGPSDIAEVLRFPAANIQSGGSGASDIAVVASIPGNFGLNIAFDPTPTGLPLVGSRVAHRFSGHRQ
jgi:hypothetical protein